MIFSLLIRTLRGSSTGLVLDVLSNGHQFEFAQTHLTKTKSCIYRGTCGQQDVTYPYGISRDACIYGTLARKPKVIKKKKNSLLISDGPTSIDSSYKNRVQR